MSKSMLIACGLIFSIINVGILIYFIELSKTISKKIFELLKLRHPEQLTKFLGSDIRAQLADFIRTDDSIQDAEYLDLKGKFLLNAKKLTFTLASVVLIECLGLLVAIFLLKQQDSTNQPIVRAVPLLVLGSLWSIYCLFEQFIKRRKGVSGGNSVPRT